VSGATGSAGGGGTGRSAYALGGEPVADGHPGPHQPPQAYQPPAAPAPPGYGPPPGGTQAALPQGAGGQAAAAQGHGQGQGGQGHGVQGMRRPRPAARPAPRTRKARLRVSRADPWSVMKVSFLLSIALGVCTIVAVAVLWMLLDSLGVFSTVGNTISDATGSGTDGGFDLQSFLSLPRVMMFTTVIAVIDVVLATALATLGAFIYNLSSGFVGGVELTLAEDE
jgi:Transmembrane domain of unknown function (DUF3566)